MSVVTGGGSAAATIRGSIQCINIRFEFVHFYAFFFGMGIGEMLMNCTGAT
jgi:hypothetical protein